MAVPSEIRVKYTGKEPLSVHYPIQGILEFLPDTEYVFELDNIAELNLLFQTNLFERIMPPTVEEVPVPVVEDTVEVLTPKKKGADQDNK
jgi:hypothetical protein